MARDAGDHAVCIAKPQHAGGEDIAVIIDQALHVPAQIAAALQPLVQPVGIVGIVVRQPGIPDFQIILRQAQLSHVAPGNIVARHQHRAPQPWDWKA